MMQRIYRWMEKLVDRNDRKNGLKTRSEIMSELVDTSIELDRLKADIELIPDAVIRLLSILFNEGFHKSTTRLPRMDIAQQEKSLEAYLDLAVKYGVSARELLGMDPVEFTQFMVENFIDLEVRAAERRANVWRSDRITLLHSVSDAAEQVGL